MSNSNILVAAFAYNEIKYISYMVEYYRGQGCDLLILDNYSTDGTYEWLKENNVRTVRVNTEDTFHLLRLQAALIEELRKIRPTWLLYTGVDTYFYFPGTIVEEVAIAMEKGCTTIEVAHIEMCNTGERFQLPFQEVFFYAKMGKPRSQMFVRYDPSLRFSGDHMYVRDMKTWHGEGALINYGMCKPKEEREITLERRKKAWKLGNPIGHGNHYVMAQAHDWLWKKESLVDIRTTKYYQWMTR